MATSQALVFIGCTTHLVCVELENLLVWIKFLPEVPMTNIKMKRQELGVVAPQHKHLRDRGKQNSGS